MLEGRSPGNRVDGWPRHACNLRRSAQVSPLPPHAPPVLLRTADAGARERHLLGIQRSAGNKALGRSLAHAPGPPGAVQRTKGKGPKSKDRAPKVTWDRKGLETIRMNAESRHDQITGFIQESRGTLNTYKSRLLSAAATYKEAYKRHKKVLDAAGTSARERTEMIASIAGFAAGVALGAPGVVAFNPSLATTATSIGSELVELAVSKGAEALAGGPGPGAFEPTAESPEVKELNIWRTLAETSDVLLRTALLTAKQMKIVSAAGIAIAEVRLREGGAKNLEKTDDQLLALVGGLKQCDEASAGVDTELGEAKAAIQRLGPASPRYLSVDEVQQDIWIEWIADLTDDDLLDEDEITDHLEWLGVIGEGRLVYDDETGETRRQPPRLDVDFGAWVSDDDEEEAVRLARAKLGRLSPTPVSGGYDED